MSAVVWRNPGIRIEPQYDQFSGAETVWQYSGYTPWDRRDPGEGQTSGNGNISVTLPNGMPGEMNGYVAPSMDQMADSGGCQRQDRIYSRAAGRTADSGSGSTESEGNIRFRRNGRRGCHFPQRSIRIIRC